MLVFVICDNIYKTMLYSLQVIFVSIYRAFLYNKNQWEVVFYEKSIMKRISLMLLISVLVMMFVGCNADTDTEEPMNSQETQVPATQEGEDENTDVPEEIEEEEEIEDEGDGTPFNNGDKKELKQEDYT